MISHNEGSGFLPEKYEVPSSGGNYLKLREGANKIRILSSPVLGWVRWIDTPDGRRPARSPFDQKPSAAELKHCWLLTIWDYQTSSVAVAEFTQTCIQEGLRDLARNPAWGSPTGFDVSITRKGIGLDTKYSLLPAPKADLPKDVRAVIDATPVHLEVLFENGNPFEATQRATD